MNPSEVKSGMWVIYKGEMALVVAPFLNYVTIILNGVETTVNYSQIKAL